MLRPVAQSRKFTGHGSVSPCFLPDAAVLSTGVGAGVDTDNQLSAPLTPN